MSGNTFAALTYMTNSAWPEGGFLVVVAGSLLGALIVFNTFCNSLRSVLPVMYLLLRLLCRISVAQFTTGGAPIHTAIIERLQAMMRRLFALQVCEVLCCVCKSFG